MPETQNFNDGNPPRMNLLGVGVSAINMTRTLQIIHGLVENRGTGKYICVTPAHSIMDAYHDPQVRHIYNHSGLTTPDGMPLVWLLKRQGFKDVDRVYGPDLMLAACKEFSKDGFRHYFLGGSPETNEKLCQNLQNKFPGMNIAGRQSPPFRALTENEESKMIAEINSCHPDILWVAFGAPRQDIWMAEHIKNLDVPVLIGVGAAFDFLSGFKKQAPRWVQRSGFEWLYRLFHEPKRLWQRYLLNYPKFIFLVLMQMLGWKIFSLD